ncbi:putative dehydrogenase [Comamonas sp. BIGb0124]|uniref:Gfo/Idh/MocA family protein n=1 Tax=Comamonas sp. BIGb0124 TaxID=2485130 RepID=UPI000F486493|nr:Gfo/Idh/MocA family oxidoreductase [Comamonas sp. BIGb0124]ROR24245.1 putative dehydrogenase [Comamonas sp. BIGb0124]
MSSSFAFSGQPLRVGVLGCANIARQFIRDVRGSTRLVVTTVASRQADNAQTFARENQVERALGSYEALLADPDVDAIYLPLPNSLHAPWAIAAVRAGKHVLCEKPLALNLHEARQMAEAAAQHGVVLLESYPYAHQPQTQALLGLVRDGSIGEVVSVSASFGFSAGNPQTNIRFQPSLGGGALLDAGSYPVSLIRLVMGEAPRRVLAMASYASSDVDMRTAALLEYADGRHAMLSCAMDTANHRHAVIAGRKGTIETEYLNHASDRPEGDAHGYLPSLLRIRRGTLQSLPFEAVSTPSGSGFRFAAEAFADLVARHDLAAAQQAARASIDIAATLDAIALSARTGQAVELRIDA